MRMLAAFVACATLFCFCGCSATPDGSGAAETVWSYATNRIGEAVARHGSSATTDTGRTGDGRANEEARGGSTGTPSDGSSRPVVAEPFDADWRYGGFKGGGAKEVSDCRIGSLKVGKDKLTYKWVSGGCEALGAKDKGDYSKTLACAFYWDGSRWVGGKFDWISTSRTSRSLENIADGYNGWNANAFFAAKRHGFCIVSSDGKRRSNFIED